MSDPQGEVDVDAAKPTPELEVDAAKPTMMAEAPAVQPGLCNNLKALRIIAAFFACATVALMVTTIVFATEDDSSDSSKSPGYDMDENPCSGKRPDLDNVKCIQDQEEVFTTGEQSGANVTKGYIGSRDTDAVPITKPYSEMGMCPVNVHWHIGAEHYSVGEYDEEGTGPIDFHEGRQGFQCRHYDANDVKFTKPYNWQYCIGMTVGQTYEVHWPHSAAGACDTKWQYQTPFYDGVFCMDDVITDTAGQIGVQSQTFVIVNDEDYYYDNLFAGMIVDGEKGTDIAYYTGSTTGTQRDNQICSPFSPITWQVDRKCHIVSASSFDKMCSEMYYQADNMKDDLYAHGSRELVDSIHVANNQQRKLRNGAE